MIDRESFLNETGDPTSQSTKHVARELHDKGFEMTPQQVVNERKKIYNKIREAMLKKGHKLPDDDYEVFKLLCKALRSKE